MREKFSSGAFTFLALMTIASICQEMPNKTEENLGTNITTSSSLSNQQIKKLSVAELEARLAILEERQKQRAAAFNIQLDTGAEEREVGILEQPLNNRHSIRKRDAAEYVEKGLTFTSQLFTTLSVISFEAPPVAAILAGLSGVFSMGSTIASFFKSPPPPEKKGEDPKVTENRKLLEAMRGDVIKYGEALLESNEKIKVQLQLLGQDIEVLSELLEYSNEYQTLETFFNNTFITKNPKIAKENFLGAANDSKIDKILNGIRVHMLKHTYFTEAIVNSDYNGKAYGAWMENARNLLYKTIIMKTFALGVQGIKYKQSVELETHINKARSILNDMARLGRKMYWEKDFMKRLNETMPRWMIYNFDNREQRQSQMALLYGFVNFMAKYHEFGEKFVIVGQPMRVVTYSRHYVDNSSYAIQHSILNSTENLIIQKIEKHKSYLGNTESQSLIIYIIRLTPEQIKTRGNYTKVPEYIKHIGKAYGDTAGVGPNGRQPWPVIFKSNTEQSFKTAITAAKKMAGEPKKKDCMFHLARLSQKPYDRRSSEENKNHIVSWTNLETVYLRDFSYDTNLPNVPYLIDTFALC